jgi:RNA polymerase sigma factor (TIGR02999 family)
MRTPGSAEVTKLLLAWGAGSEKALPELLPVVYAELHQLAKRCMASEHPGHTLQASALVNEVYLKLVDNRRAQWQNRAQFFGVSAQLMRRILVDAAQRRHYLKRGGGTLQVTLHEEHAISGRESKDLVAIDDALTSLETLDARKAQIVEMRFFAGLSVEETAQALHVSEDTVLRDWKLAKSWLYKELNKGAQSKK